MKHLKKYRELFENSTSLSQEQIKWLDKCTKGKRTLNPDTGLIDIDGDFDCSADFLVHSLGVNFGVVTGNFNCSDNSLSSLVGAPQEVGGDFLCYRNMHITSLEGAPRRVGRNFDCSVNKIKSLLEGPQIVGGSYICEDNKLTDLKGVPEEVSGDLHCSGNDLVNLEGAPRKVGRDLTCQLNGMKSLKGGPVEIGESFDCSYNELITLEGAPKKINRYFDCSHNELKNLKGGPTEIGWTFICNKNELNSLEGRAKIIGHSKEYQERTNVGKVPIEYDSFNSNKGVSGETLKMISKEMDKGISYLDAIKNLYVVIPKSDWELLDKSGLDMNDKFFKGGSLLRRFS